ncbi:MAG: cytochrome b/b6 domain-containing protein [Thiobacillaceae bacterium]|jgi:cytochrome b|nr:cytochrome b/b6 domain-containing protein [Thiobacillaceae bacterium]
MERILVWDWPTRIGHWLMAVSFLVAYLTGDSETWRLVHVFAGGTLAGLVAFRVLWGLIGTRHARFSDFLRAPSTAWRYLTGLVSGKAPHYAGHNPAGGYAVFALLLLGALAAVSGWPVYQDIGGEWLEEVHEAVVNLMLLVVGVHLAGVVVGSLAHHENLPRAMVTGYKLGKPGEAIARGHLWAVSILIGSAVAAAWWLSR